MAQAPRRKTLNQHETFQYMKMAKIEKKKRLIDGRKGLVTFALLIAYLFSPLVALSQDPARAAVAPPRRGAQDVYIICAACHKMDGSGGPGYGGFAASFRKTILTHDELVGVITNGRRERGMPPFQGVLSSAEIDAMATFVETEFKGKP